MTNEHRISEIKSAHRQSFEHYLRTRQRFTTEAWKALQERKYNHNHDPHNGQFTSGPSGAMTSPVKVQRTGSARAPAVMGTRRATPPSPQTHAPTIAPIRGYPEEGPRAWRKSSDAIFKRVAEEYNARHGLKPGDVQYMHPKLMKAWAMVESGGSQKGH